jgi:flagellar biogenesis protein FliO
MATMTATRLFAPTTAAAIVTLLAFTPAAAQPIGPGIADMPPARPAPSVRTAAEIDAELSAMNAAIGSALDAEPPITGAIVRPEPTPVRTPLGAPAPAELGTALITAERPARASGGGLAQTVLALGGVLLLVVGLSWVYKRIARASGGLSGSLGAGGRAPAGVVEVLARYPLAARHTLVVLRFDRRVLLCSMTGGSRSSGAGMTVLSELDDPEDIASVLIKTRDEAGESIARSFERSLREAERSTDETFERATVRIPRPASTAAEARGAYATDASRRPADAGGLRRGLETIWTGGRR